MRTFFPAFHACAAAAFLIGLHPGIDDDPYGAARQKRHGAAHGQTRRFATLGIGCALAELAQSVGRYLEAFDRNFQIGFSRSEPDAHPCGRTALAV